MIQSLRESLGIPSHVPESMVYAIQAQLENNKRVTNVLDDRQEKIRTNSRIARGNSITSLLEKCGFENQGGIYPDFQNKNILDIGGGFGGVAPVLSDSYPQIIVVDPIFKESNLDTYYQEDLRKVTERLKELNQSLRGQANQRSLEARARNAKETRETLSEIQWWKTYNPQREHRHITRNSSYGERLEGVQDNSQDFVFVNYVLFKGSVRVREFLYEIKRVLKQGGCMILSDYKGDEEADKKKFDDGFEIMGSIFSRGKMDFVQNSIGRVIVKIYK